MSSKGLGRGLDALFGGGDDAFPCAPSNTLRIFQIEPNPAQPRKDFELEALKTLAQSIREHGLLQPLVVRPAGEDMYIIIAGERRWRACRMAGLTEVPVVIIDADELRASELTLIENLQREDLSPLEEAAGYGALMDKFALTQEQIAERVGKSRPAVANALRLLGLDDRCRALLEEGKLTAGHARALLAVQNISRREALAESCIEHELSVRQLEALVKSEGRDKATPRTRDTTYTDAVARRLSESMGRRITLKSGGKKGRIEIEYYNNDDLDTLIALLENAAER